MPAATGIRRLLRKLKTGDELIVDGYNGRIVLHPTQETINKYHSEKMPLPIGSPVTEAGEVMLYNIRRQGDHDPGNL